MINISVRNTVFFFIYKHLCKPIFFLFDPEFIHDRFILIGRLLGRYAFTKKIVSSLFLFEHAALRQTICGIEFKNPVGLSAGFDKNAVLTDIIPSVGFGFVEVGSITGEPCKGNQVPRLWRLKKSQALVVNYGLKNDGAEKIALRLKKSSTQYRLEPILQKLILLQR